MISERLKTKEARTRRLAKAAGLRLHKGRSVHGYTSLHHSGPRYMVVRVWDNCVVDWGDLDEIRKRIDGGVTRSPFPDVP